MTGVIENYNVEFWSFVHRYDISNTNILRKVIHSFLVAENSFFLACNLKLSKKECEFAYLVGLFHDIGRFEQWKQYQTYNDKISVDHGLLGSQIIDALQLDGIDLCGESKQLLKDAVKYHTKNYEGEDKKTILYSGIVRDADKFSNLSTIANGAMPITQTEDGFTKEIVDDFKDLKPLFNYSPKTKLDRMLILTSMAYNIKNAWLREQVIQKHYLDIIYQRFSQELEFEDSRVLKDAIDTIKHKLL
ncbi:MAG: HD domain-containing protein [Clostridia bacterium]|nr:HD domain-containing protein [Clostridia bacterium]